jgi:hypothetical protein
MANEKNEERQNNDANRPLRLDQDVKRLTRDTGISESQAIALVHRFGKDRSAMLNAAAKLVSFGR